MCKIKERTQRNMQGKRSGNNQKIVGGKSEKHKNGKDMEYDKQRNKKRQSQSTKPYRWKNGRNILLSCWKETNRMKKKKERIQSYGKEKNTRRKS